MGKEALSNTPRCAAHTIMAQWVQVGELLQFFTCTPNEH